MRVPFAKIRLIFIVSVCLYVAFMAHKRIICGAGRFYWFIDSYDDDDDESQDRAPAKPKKKTHGIWHLWIWIWVTLLIWFRKSHWNFPLFLLDTSNKFKGIRLNSEIHVDKRIHWAQENKRSVRFWFYAYAEVWIIVKMFFICWSFAMKRHGSPFSIALHWRLFPFYLAKFLEYLQLCVCVPRHLYALTMDIGQFLDMARFK